MLVGSFLSPYVNMLFDLGFRSTGILMCHSAPLYACLLKRYGWMKLWLLVPYDIFPTGAHSVYLHQMDLFIMSRSVGSQVLRSSPNMLQVAAQLWESSSPTMFSALITFQTFLFLSLLAVLQAYHRQGVLVGLLQLVIWRSIELLILIVRLV